MGTAATFIQPKGTLRRGSMDSVSDKLSTNFSINEVDEKAAHSPGGTVGSGTYVSSPTDEEKAEKKTLPSSAADKWRKIIIDLLIDLGIPVLAMAFGSTCALILSAIYCILTLKSFLHRRKQFSELMASSPFTSPESLSPMAILPQQPV
ncbi:hypothetical protein LXA43DRAFT_1152171 [Ganoderma leucocontextum]|nr:hypothetical protein LXA43DRAFT_1152171 [Ganoderma leucocontextum]